MARCLAGNGAQKTAVKVMILQLEPSASVRLGDAGAGLPSCSRGHDGADNDGMLLMCRVQEEPRPEVMAANDVRSCALMWSRWQGSTRRHTRQEIAQARGNVNHVTFFTSVFSHVEETPFKGLCDRSHHNHDGASSHNVFSPRPVTCPDLSSTVRCSRGPRAGRTTGRSEVTAQMHVYHSVDTTSNSRQGSRNLNLKHSRWDQHARGFRADHFTHLVGLSQRRRKIREPRGENGKSPGTSGRQKREPKRWQRETRPARHGGVRWRTGPRDRSAGSPSKPERRRRGFPLRAVGKERSPADALLWARRQPPYTSVFRNRKESEQKPFN
uniref:Uncharacterized protein n=1 Tax=Rousettus aegyptiacus TaxID=9407 RepID=A0A7J8BRM7_ROUAE|nr:hypothetical protein HJG63_009508 [Rousettus aegyptiacus]